MIATCQAAEHVWLTDTELLLISYYTTNWMFHDHWLCFVPNILSSRSLLKLFLTFISFIRKKSVANDLQDGYVYKLPRSKICIRIWLRVITLKNGKGTLGNGKKKRVKSNLEERNEYNLVLHYK